MTTPLKWFARNSLRVFAAAAAVAGVIVIAAMAVTSVEAVSLAIDQMAAVLDWVRPAVLIAVFAGWPWVLAFLLRRRWIDDEECRLLLVHWDELAALMVFLELAFGQGLPLTGFLFYAVWRIYRRFRPSRRLC
ncbi:MAG TPA: hypothetical protein VES39_06200 [Rhodospirillales bacterium]|nr:hypothetical protein [Rhodospirillales bacterium]